MAIMSPDIPLGRKIHSDDGHLLKLHYLGIYGPYCVTLLDEHVLVAATRRETYHGIFNATAFTTNNASDIQFSLETIKGHYIVKRIFHIIAAFPSVMIHCTVFKPYELLLFAEIYILLNFSFLLSDLHEHRSEPAR